MDALPGGQFHDCHIFSLPSQGGVYTLCRFPTPASAPSASRCRLLAASLRRPVYLLEFNHGYKQTLVPYSRELSFTYLSGMSEIVSITAFSKPGTSSSVIAAAYIKVGGGGGQCLNIYTVKENGGADLNGEGLAFSCSVEIDFIPYHLTHCLTSLNEMTIVLTGSDNRVHLFVEDPITHIAKEKPGGSCEDFPEFRIDFPSVVLWVEFHKTRNLRLTAVGCECGFLALYRVCLETGAILDVSTTNHGTSITSCRFFSLPDGSSHHVQLLVTSALMPSVVYGGVETDGLNGSCQTLQGSERHDVVTCSLVCDIHMDGQPTILLGTYGQELLAYRLKWKDHEGEDSWELAWSKSFGHPILSLDYCDVTGDGVKELIAMTARGVQILQHDLDQVADLLIRRLREPNFNPLTC